MRQAVRARRTARRPAAQAAEPARGRKPAPEQGPAPGREPARGHAPRRWAVAAWAVLGCAVLYGLLAWQVAVAGPVRDLDERAGPALARHAPPGAELLADLGGVWVTLPVLAAAMLYAVWRTPVRAGAAPGSAARTASAPARRHTPRTPHRLPYRLLDPLVRRVPAAVRVPLVAGAAAFAVLPAVVLPLKSAQARPGPRGPLADDYAGFFPSGHATTAAVAYGAVVLLLLPLLRSRAARRLLAAAAGAVVAGAGAGLVWREYHWPLDVLAGWCVAGALLAGCRYGAARLTAYAAARVIPHRPDRLPPADRP
ncbi:phosphatase PAP2 family protein [Streptomyces sp. WMMC500]|uniref:phosphatase PAP2 family protein n=1 Tax=Streptomyces sp. WMMC500 TaxID=3015154 RepID=UPI00248B7E39|nr:phosphatase PAP2 family protein [Streptomyces sp. WMMC500]WBB62742.1 phosphatase PAP2 family protein [Streptomyces sp. WMMC500]